MTDKIVKDWLIRKGEQQYKSKVQTWIMMNIILICVALLCVAVFFAGLDFGCYISGGMLDRFTCIIPRTVGTCEYQGGTYTGTGYAKADDGLYYKIDDENNTVYRRTDAGDFYDSGYQCQFPNCVNLSIVPK